MSPSENTLVCFVLALALCAGVQSGSIAVSDGRYISNWSVDEKHITVEITVETLGYIGWGISFNQSMIGADLFIAGVYDNNTNYHYDFHGVTNNAPVLDDVDNYELLSASQTSNTTTIRFRRALETGDNEGDKNITNSNQYILWAIGGSDDLDWHFRTRGAYETNLLDDTTLHYIKN